MVNLPTDFSLHITYFCFLERFVGHVIRYQDANPISSILVGREFLIISETTDARIVVHTIEIASGYSSGVAKSANGKASGRGTKIAGPNGVSKMNPGGKSRLLTTINNILFSQIGRVK